MRNIEHRMKKQFTQKTYTYTTGLQVLRKYCAYQERSHSEVLEKALSLRFTNQEADRALCQLIEENFLNEERFASMYTQGKWRTKHWGPQKIKLMLQQKGVSKTLINESLSHISDGEQRQTIKQLIAKKLPLINEKNSFLKKQKLIRYLIGKGFETEKILSCVEKILNEE